MKLNLTKYEKETILLTSEGDNTIKIYTFNAGLKKRLKSYSALYPDLCWLVDEDKDNGSVTYMVQKARVSIQFTPPYSEERRRALGERMRSHGVQIKEKSC